MVSTTISSFLGTSLAHRLFFFNNSKGVAINAYIQTNRCFVPDRFALRGCRNVLRKRPRTRSSYSRMPGIRDQLGSTPSQLAFALVCIGIGSLLGMPFTGRLVERYSSGVVSLVATIVCLGAGQRFQWLVRSPCWRSCCCGCGCHPSLRQSTRVTDSRLTGLYRSGRSSPTRLVAAKFA
jgi:hypothetical protein